MTYKVTCPYSECDFVGWGIPYENLALSAGQAHMFIFHGSVWAEDSRLRVVMPTVADRYFGWKDYQSIDALWSLHFLMTDIIRPYIEDVENRRSDPHWRILQRNTATGFYWEKCDRIHTNPSLAGRPCPHCGGSS